MENPEFATVLADTAPAASADRAVRVEDFTQLCPRAVDDPQRLHGRVMESLDHYFLTRGSTYLSGQRETLSDIVNAVLDDSHQGVFAVPLIPGGKSTLLRALLTVFAEVFRDVSDHIAQRLGGVIVVVEKTAEGDELEVLCNRGLEPGEPPVARLLSAVNDYNLKKGRCLTGEARTYAECPRHTCREAANCPLLHTMEGLGETPILILLHARLAEHLPDLTSFTAWFEADGTEHRRSLLLIDEAPELVRQDVVSAQSLNEAEGELLDMRPSYSREDRYAKQRTLESFVHALRIPFDRLQRCEYGKTRRSAVLTVSELEQAGFKNDQLTELMTRLEEYQAQRSSKAGKLATALLTDNGKLTCFGKNFELASPSLHTIRADTPLRTFIFSGTAQLIPQLTDNPNVTLLDTNFQESYARLTIHVQRDSVLKTSRTGLQTTGALEALVLCCKYCYQNLPKPMGESFWSHTSGWRGGCGNCWVRSISSWYSPPSSQKAVRSVSPTSAVWPAATSSGTPRRSSAWVCHVWSRESILVGRWPLTRTAPTWRSCPTPLRRWSGSPVFWICRITTWPMIWYRWRFAPVSAIMGIQPRWSCGSPSRRTPCWRCCMTTSGTAALKSTRRFPQSATGSYTPADSATASKPTPHDCTRLYWLSQKVRRRHLLSFGSKPA